MATALSKLLATPKHKDAARYLSLALTGAITATAIMGQGNEGSRFDITSTNLMAFTVSTVQSKAEAARESDAAFNGIVELDARVIAADATDGMAKTTAAEISGFLDRNDLEGLSRRLADLGGSPDDVIYTAMEQRSDMMKRMSGRLADLAESIKANDQQGAALAHDSLTQAIDEYETVFLGKEKPSEHGDSVEDFAQKTEALGMVLRMASGFKL